MKRKKLSLEYISGLLTILIPRMEDTTKRQMLSLIFLVVATILEYIRGLLTVLTPRMEDATKRQMHSLISLVMATMFVMTPLASADPFAPPSYTIVKNVTDVDGHGPGGNVTKAGDIITYQINVNNTGEVELTNVNVTDPLIHLDNATDNVTTIAGGQNWNYTGNYTVTQEDINSNGTGTGFINNTVTVYSDQFDNPENRSANVTIIQNPSYEIEKTIIGVTDSNGSKGNVTAAGDVIAYQVNVTNHGNIDLNNVTVTDSLIDLTGPVVKHNDTVLNVTETWTFTGNYTVTQEDLNSNGTGTGFIDNIATVVCDQLAPQNDSANVTIIQNPSYAIEKTVTGVNGQSGGNVTAAGDVIAYQVNVTNNGNIDLTNVNVTDPLVNNLTGNNDTVLNVTETWTFTGNYTVTQEDLNSNGTGTGFIDNTATVVCDQLAPQNDSANVTIIQNPSYAIEKTVTGVNGQSGGNVTAAGDVIAYQVNVTNNGNIDLTNVNVTDPLVNNLTGNNDTVLNVTQTWTFTGNYTVTQEDLNSNGTGTGFIDNTATVDCDQLAPQNDSANVTIIQNPSYAIEKTVTGVNGQSGGNVTAAGDVIAYQVNVTNNGNIDLTNVNVTDPLVNNLTGNNDTVLNVTETWTFTGNYTVTQEDLNSNGTRTGFIDNTATVDCDQLNPQNDSVQTLIIQDPSYTIEKTVTGVNGQSGGNVTAAGDVIAYQVNVTNDGNIDLNNVNVTDSLISLTGPVESNSNDTVLNVGESWTYSGNYTVTQEEINTNGTAGDGFINNNATVDCDLLDPQNDTVQVPIERNPSNAIDKSVIDVAGKGPEGNATEAGDVIAYQVKVTNDGNIDLTNVNVTDSLTNLAGPVESNSNDTILEVGENWTYTGNYTVTQADINSNGTAGSGFINNTATVYSDQVGSKSDSASVDPKSDSADVSIKRNPNYNIFKSVIGPDEDGDCIVNSAGDEVPYRIVINNDGNVDLTGVSVSDPMIMLTGPTGDDIDPGVFNLGETWVYNGIYTLTPDDINNGNGYIDNIATVSSNEIPEETSNVSQPIDQNADLSIQKSVIGIDETGDYMINQPGDIINYQIAVKNNGDVDLTGVSVNDPMIALTGPTGDHADPGVLNPGETWVYTGDYEVAQGDIDGSVFIENTATVSCKELSEESSSTVLPIIPIIIPIPPIIVTPEPESKVLPIANFNANPMSGYAPLAVQFTDASQNAASRSWDFNNDGIADSSEVSPVHTYTAPGTYTANLTVSNANGTNSKTAPITVLQVTSNSGGSSHSSGGSIGGGKLSTVSSSTGNTSATGTAVIQPENKTQVEQKTETTAANVEQTPEKKTDTSTPAKESKRTPGFEIISGIVGLCAVFLYRRK